jgi:hypothetical protein
MCILTGIERLFRRPLAGDASISPKLRASFKRMAAMLRAERLSK